jgi:hypothetical protein
MMKERRRLRRGMKKNKNKKGKQEGQMANYNRF